MGILMGRKLEERYQGGVQRDSSSKPLQTSLNEPGSAPRRSGAAVRGARAPGSPSKIGPREFIRGVAGNKSAFLGRGDPGQKRREPSAHVRRGEDTRGTGPKSRRIESNLPAETAEEKKPKAANPVRSLVERGLFHRLKTFRSRQQKPADEITNK